VSVNGHAYRSTVAVMGGRSMVGVSAHVRAATGLVAGDPLRVTLTVADATREVHVPADLAAAFADHPEAGTFFAELSNSLQRLHVDSVNGAKTPETRRRRIDRTVALFRAGRKR
jgi:hypothetical protein